MAESFKLFNSDFECTNNTDTANYIVLTNPTKAIDEDELFNYWLDRDSITDEIEDIRGHWRYYFWEDACEKYLPLTDNNVIEKLHEEYRKKNKRRNKFMMYFKYIIIPKLSQFYSTYPYLFELITLILWHVGRNMI